CDACCSQISQSSTARAESVGEGINAVDADGLALLADSNSTSRNVPEWSALGGFLKYCCPKMPSRAFAFPLALMVR
ncbi:UNVERIFIED_CONTAM: hypothetical protein NY603_25240, partial [Bacteroidetes bacterium 56_B9]